MNKLKTFIALATTTAFLQTNNNIDKETIDNTPISSNLFYDFSHTVDLIETLDSIDNESVSEDKIKNLMNLAKDLTSSQLLFITNYNIENEASRINKIIEKPKKRRVFRKTKVRDFYEVLMERVLSNKKFRDAFIAWTKTADGKNFFKPFYTNSDEYTSNLNSWHTTSFKPFLDFLRDGASDSSFATWFRTPEGRRVSKRLYENHAQYGADYGTWKARPDNFRTIPTYADDSASDTIFTSYTKRADAKQVLKPFYEASVDATTGYRAKSKVWIDSNKKTTSDYVASSDSDTVYSNWLDTVEAKDALKKHFKASTTDFNEKFNIWKMKSENFKSKDSYAQSSDSNLVYDTWKATTDAKQALKTFYEASVDATTGFGVKSKDWIAKNKKLVSDYVASPDSNSKYVDWIQSSDAKRVLAPHYKSDTLAFDTKFDIWKMKPANFKTKETFADSSASDTAYNNWRTTMDAKTALKFSYEKSIDYATKSSAWISANRKLVKDYVKHSDSDAIYKAWLKTTEARDVLSTAYKNSGIPYNTRFNLWVEKNWKTAQDYAGHKDSDTAYENWRDTTDALSVLDSIFTSTNSGSNNFRDAYNTWKKSQMLASSLLVKDFINDPASDSIFNTWRKNDGKADIEKFFDLTDQVSEDIALNNIDFDNDNTAKSKFDRYKETLYGKTNHSLNQYKEYLKLTVQDRKWKIYKAFLKSDDFIRNNIPDDWQDDDKDEKYWFSGDPKKPKKSDGFIKFNILSRTIPGRRLINFLEKNNREYGNKFISNIERAIGSAKGDTKVLSSAELADAIEVDDIDFEKEKLTHTEKARAYLNGLGKYVVYKSPKNVEYMLFTEKSALVDKDGESKPKVFIPYFTTYKRIKAKEVYYEDFDYLKHWKSQPSYITQRDIWSDGKKLDTSASDGAGGTVKTKFETWLSSEIKAAKSSDAKTAFRQWKESEMPVAESDFKKTQVYKDTRKNWVDNSKANLDVKRAFAAAMSSPKTNGDQRAKNAYDAWKKLQKNLKTDSQYVATGFSGDYGNDIENWATIKPQVALDEFFKAASGTLTGGGHDPVKTAYDSWHATSTTEDDYKNHPTYDADLALWARGKKVETNVKVAFIAAMTSDKTNGDQQVKNAYDTWKIKTKAEYESTGIDGEYGTDIQDWAGGKYQEARDEFFDAASGTLTGGGHDAVKTHYESWAIRTETEYNASTQYGQDLASWAQGKKANTDVKAAFIVAMSSAKTNGDQGVKSAYDNWKIKNSSNYENTGVSGDYGDDIKDWANVKSSDTIPVNVIAEFKNAASGTLTGGGHDVVKTNYESWARRTETEYKDSSEYGDDLTLWAQDKKADTNVKNSFITWLQSETAKASSAAKTSYDSFKIPPQSLYEASQSFEANFWAFTRQNKIDPSIMDAFERSNLGLSTYNSWKIKDLSQYEREAQFSTDIIEWSKNKTEDSAMLRSILKIAYSDAAKSEDGNKAFSDIIKSI